MLAGVESCAFLGVGSRYKMIFNANAITSGGAKNLKIIIA